MCGRITQKLTLETLVAKYRAREHPELDLTPRFNGCPGQDFVVVRREGSERQLAELRWGRIPEWAANKPGAKRLINARFETVHEKPSFRAAFRERRCVIPVTGWFEWKPVEGGRQPYWLRPEATELFSLAAIWESGGTSPGAVDTCVILTMAAAPAIADIHHRQPVILDDEATTAWLRPGAAPAGLISMTKKGCGSAFDRWPVSSLVNSPRNDSPDLLMPAMTTGPTGGAGGMQLGLL